MHCLAFLSLFLSSSWLGMMFDYAVGFLRASMRKRWIGMRADG